MRHGAGRVAEGSEAEDTTEHLASVVQPPERGRAGVGKKMSAHQKLSLTEP